MSMRVHIGPLLCMCAITSLVMGCSLLTVKAPGKPLTPNELNQRVLMYDYADSFQATVAQTADEIEAHSPDPGVQRAALKWKIEAVAASRRAATQIVPMMALLDSWALAAQMLEFFDQGAGARLFGHEQSAARGAADQLDKDIVRIAGTVTTPAEFTRYQTFVGGYVQRFPLKSLDFKRTSVVDRWLAQPGEDPPLLSTVGTAPEIMSDFEERMRLYANDLPAETFWKAQLALRQSENDPGTKEFRRTMQQIDDSLANIGEAATASPALVRSSIAELRGSLIMALDRLDQSKLDVLQDVSTEREALAQIVEHERTLITSDVDMQRVAIARDAARITNHAIETSWNNARGLVRELALFGLAGMIIVLGLPFAAGYLVGVARTRPKS